MKRNAQPQAILATSPAIEAANRKVHDQIVARCCNVSPTVGEDGELSTPCPCDVGKDYPVKQVSFYNIHGGTELATVRARAKVVARWWDYETGWRFTGEVQEMTGAAISRFTKEPIALPVCVRFGQFDLRKQPPPSPPLISSYHEYVNDLHRAACQAARWRLPLRDVIP